MFEDRDSIIQPKSPLKEESSTREFPSTIKITRSKERGISFVPTAETNRAVQRFEQFIQKLLATGTTSGLSLQQHAVASVIAFEGIAHSSDVILFLEKLHTATRWAGHVYVSWERELGLARRSISAFTTIAFNNLHGTVVDWKAEFHKFQKTLAVLYPFRKSVHIGSRIDYVLQDAQAWLYFNLPMPLVAHVLGAIPMTPLSDLAWLRRHRLPLPTPEMTTALPEASALEPLHDAAIETIYQNQLQLSGGWVVDDLSKLGAGLSGPGVKLSHAKALTELISRLKTISLRINEAGPIEALLLGWALDLAQFGSATKKDPRVATMANYINSAARRLHRSIRDQGEHPLSLTTEQWDALFTALLDAEPENASLRPALASFHRYLIRTIDADPLFWLFRKSATERKPRANVIWPHEFDRMPPLFETLTDDPRLLQQLICWVAFMRCTSLRLGELVGLQLHSIRIYKNGIEIEVAPHRGHRPVKSHAARRIISINDSTSQKIIESWLERRTNEGADTDELLFGDPYQVGNLYKFGICYRLFNTGLRLATHDPEVSMHICRHADLTNAIETALMNLDHFEQVNPFHRIKVRAGHAQEETSFLTYAHLYEDPLRHWLDRQFIPRLKSYASVAAWTGLSAANLRQTMHRKGKMGWTLWQGLSDFVSALKPLPQKPISEELTQSSSDASPLPASFDQTVHIVGDLAVGRPISEIALRSSVPPASISAIAAMMMNIGRAQLEKTGNRSFLLAHPDDESALPEHTVKVAALLNADYSRLQSSYWPQLMPLLAECATQPKSPVLSGWLSCSKESMLSLEKPTLVKPLLALLRRAGFDANWIVMKISRRPSQQEFEIDGLLSGEAVQASLRSFRHVFSAHPQIELMDPRRGRFGVYMQIMTKPLENGNAAPSASCDMRSFNALMLAATVHQWRTAHADGKMP